MSTFEKADRSPNSSSLSELSSSSPGTVKKSTPPRRSQKAKKCGGIMVEKSKNTLRADPSCILALMLQPLSPFYPSNNVYFDDRDPAHFKIILYFLRNNCNIEKRYLPTEHVYLFELLQEATSSISYRDL